MNDPDRGLEGPIRSRMRFGGGTDGIERAEIVLADEAYALHRHDTYALGMTIAGVQAFRYRGSARASLSGNVFVLHPDELHDGHPATEADLAYRALYVAPRRIAEALEGTLPFVPEPVSSDPRLTAAMRLAMADFGAPIDEMQATGIVASIADALKAVADKEACQAESIDTVAMERVAALIDAAPEEDFRIETLERISGLERWALYRQFRLVHGVSPYRYVKMRRLDRARTLIRSGLSLAEAAVASGFADQSHMTRQFKETYGFAPGRWRRMQTRDLPLDRLQIAFQ